MLSGVCGGDFVVGGDFGVVQLTTLIHSHHRDFNATSHVLSLVSLLAAAPEG